jgi:hypothetical protein
MPTELRRLLETVMVCHVIVGSAANAAPEWQKNHLGMSMRQ